jgi:hypothetical protein
VARVAGLRSGVCTPLGTRPVHAGPLQSRRLAPPCSAHTAAAFLRAPPGRSGCGTWHALRRCSHKQPLLQILLLLLPQSQHVRNGRALGAGEPCAVRDRARRPGPSGGRLDHPRGGDGGGEHGSCECAKRQHAGRPTAGKHGGRRGARPCRAAVCHGAGGARGRAEHHNAIGAPVAIGLPVATLPPQPRTRFLYLALARRGPIV